MKRYLFPLIILLSLLTLWAVATGDLCGLATARDGAGHFPAPTEVLQYLQTNLKSVVLLVIIGTSIGTPLAMLLHRFLTRKTIAMALQFAAYLLIAWAAFSIASELSNTPGAPGIHRISAYCTPMGINILMLCAVILFAGLPLGAASVSKPGLRRCLITTLFFIYLILIWGLLTGDLLWLGVGPEEPVWNPYVLPSPGVVGQYLWDNIVNLKIVNAMGVTLKRLLIGYAIGLVLGVPLGMLSAKFKGVNDTLGVLALGLQALPSVCWVPLACIWFGQSESALLFVVIMGTLWSVLLSTQNGMKNVPPIYARAARTMGSGHLHTLLFVTLPASAPFVVSGMKQGWAFAWRSLMAAEIYVAVVGGFGIGQYLHFGRELQRMYQVVGIMFIIILVGLLADKLLFSPVESWLHRRWGTDKE